MKKNVGVFNIILKILQVFLLKINTFCLINKLILRFYSSFQYQ